MLKINKLELTGIVDIWYYKINNWNCLNIEIVIGYSQIFLWSILSIIIFFILYLLIGKKSIEEKLS